MTPVAEINTRELVIVHVFADIDCRHCRCGQYKRQGRAFCFGCYNKLPPATRHALSDSRERIPKAYLRALKELAIPGVDYTKVDASLAGAGGTMPVTDEYLKDLGDADQLADAACARADMLDAKWLPETFEQARTVLETALEFGNRRQIFALHILASRAILLKNDASISFREGSEVCSFCGSKLIVIEPFVGSEYAACPVVERFIERQQAERAKELFHVA